MSKLDEARQKINLIDRQMAELFVQRMEASKQVVMHKMAHGLPIYDPYREQEVINKNSEFIDDDVLKEYYISFLKDMMKVSKQYQFRIMEGLNVGYSGVEGAFGFISSKKMFPTANLIAYPNFESAYLACENGECDVVVLPIENSYAGDVGNVMDLIFSGSLFINQVLELDVNHNLVAVNDASLDTIKTVYSHHQALAQCSKYIKDHHFEQCETSNTATAAKMVAETNNSQIAAIASVETASLYGLKVLAANINTSRNNTTRFAAFSKRLNQSLTNRKMGEHFILVFTVKNEAGALAKTLNIIGAHGFNMRNLKSRPMKTLMWNYYFFVELEGKVDSIDGQDMLRELTTVCDRLKLVGTYYAD